MRINGHTPPPFVPNEAHAAAPRRAARRAGATPARRRNDHVALEQGRLGGLRPKDARHSQGGGVPFLDLDEAAVAVSSITKTGAMLINALASGIALLGAWSAAAELYEASEELPELEAQRQALTDRVPAAATAKSPGLVQAAPRNHLAAQRRVAVAQRTAVVKAALGVPSCIGALTMGLSVALGPDLLGAVFATATAAAVLMHIAVPSIALFGAGSALLHAFQGARQSGTIRALQRLLRSEVPNAKSPRTQLSDLASEALSEQRSLRRWRAAAALAGVALGAGVVLAFWMGPLGLALLLPGALALPACNAVIGGRTQYQAPSRPDHAPHATGAEESDSDDGEDPTPTFHDAADAHTYAGPLHDLANARAAAQQEQRLCHEVALGLHSGGRIRRAMARWTAPRDQLARTPEKALGETYARLLQARLVTSSGSESAAAVAQAVGENQAILRGLHADAAPWQTFHAMMRTLTAEDAVAPFMARLQRVRALEAHLPKAKDRALLLTARDVQHAVEKLPTHEQAACIRALCGQALHALVHTVRHGAQARERQAMSQFVAVAELS